MTATVTPYFRSMQENDLDAVLALEQTIYTHPWTRGNFQDSLRAGHHAWVMMQNDSIIGYAVTIVVLDEAQLLNLSVAASFHRQGYGSALLRHVNKEAAAMGADYVFLEVRASNVPAIALYQKVGFIEVSVRKGYYPLGQNREDAVIMRLAI